MNALHQQMAASKGRFQDAEDSLRQEVASLKKIITDLERKLGEFTHCVCDVCSYLQPGFLKNMLA